MKKMRKWFAAGLAAVMCMGLTACGGSFDAAGYTKAVLDANYHGEYTAYAEFRNLSEEDAQAEVEEAFASTVDETLLAAGLDASLAEDYTVVVKDLYALAKYEVLEAEEQEDGSFTVQIQAEPADVYATYQEHIEAVALEKVEAGADPADTAVLGEILIEGTQRAISGNTYGEPTTIEVHVTENSDNEYGLEDSEMQVIENTMFPQS